MKLISMVGFVLELNNYDLSEYKIESIFNYAKLLKQPLKLEMFVPCDDEGNVLEKPICNKDCDNCECMYEFNLFEEAKEKVLFEGFQYFNEFSIRNGVYWINLNEFYTIEDLIKFDLTLTQSVIKKLGL